MQSMIAAYEKHKNLKLAANELGMKWQNLYVQLRKFGTPIIGDKARYGSDKDRLAAQVESEFQKLVPNAVNQNGLRYQSKFDFLIGKEKVDIKSANAKQGSKRFDAKRWAFSVKKQEFCADFVVCFAMKEVGYRLFLIPGELVRNYQTVSISVNQESKSKWIQYEIEPNELADFFNQLNEGKIE